MHQKLALAPESLNPEIKEQFEPLSPVNLIKGKRNEFEEAQIKKEQYLINKLKELKDHIENKKKHRRVID